MDSIGRRSGTSYQVTPDLTHTVTPLDDGTFRHELSFALGHDACLELMTPDGEVRKTWTTAETGLTQWDGTHVDARSDLVWRLASGALIDRDDLVT